MVVASLFKANTPKERKRESDFSQLPSRSGQEMLPQQAQTTENQGVLKMYPDTRQSLKSKTLGLYHIYSNVPSSLPDRRKALSHIEAATFFRSSVSNVHHRLGLWDYTLSSCLLQHDDSAKCSLTAASAYRGGAEGMPTAVWSLGLEKPLPRWQRKGKPAGLLGQKPPGG